MGKILLKWIVSTLVECCRLIWKQTILYIKFWCPRGEPISPRRAKLHPTEPFHQVYSTAYQSTMVEIKTIGNERRVRCDGEPCRSLIRCAYHAPADQCSIGRKHGKLNLNLCNHFTIINANRRSSRVCLYYLITLTAGLYRRQDFSISITGIIGMPKRQLSAEQKERKKLCDAARYQKNKQAAADTSHRWAI